MMTMTAPSEGLTYTPGDLAKVAKPPARVKVEDPDRSRARDKAWATVRKLVQAGRSDRQIERAARSLG